MDKRIVWQNPDGSIALTTPCAPTVAGESEADYLARVATRTKSELVAAGYMSPKAQWVGVVDGEVHRTADRYFRNAWAWTGAVSIDMPKARDIHMGRIRAARDAELAKLDIEQLKGNDVTAEKQRLRDIPQTFDLTAAATPDELKALWPEGLPRT